MGVSIILEILKLFLSKNNFYIFLERKIGRFDDFVSTKIVFNKNIDEKLSTLMVFRD